MLFDSTYNIRKKRRKCYTKINFILIFYNSTQDLWRKQKSNQLTFSELTRKTTQIINFSKI